MVMSPRQTSARSEAAQFWTWYCVLYVGWTLDFIHPVWSAPSQPHSGFVHQRPMAALHLADRGSGAQARISSDICEPLPCYDRPMPSTESRYIPVVNILAGTVAGMFLTKLVTTNLGGWSYLVFTLATLGMFSLVRDGWSAFQRNRLHRCCKAAYEKVTLIFKPEILNPLRPGNPHFMKEDAQRAVDDAKVLMDRLGIRHPGDINVDDRCFSRRVVRAPSATTEERVLMATDSFRGHYRRVYPAPISVLAPVAVDRSPSPPRSWAKTAGSPQAHVSDARDRRDGLRQARV